MSLAAKFISKVANSFIVNTVLTPTANATAGQKTMMGFLVELSHRTILLGDCKNAREFDLMTRCIGDILQIAASDWNSFRAQYICTIGFRDSVKTSDVFTITIRENNACPRDWQFRFNNLKRPA